jgi:integrase
VRAAAGLDDVHLHDLRHTVGTVASRHGGNAFLIRDLLRHADVSMTQKYVNRDSSPLRDLANAIGDDLGALLDGDKG